MIKLIGTASVLGMLALMTTACAVDAQDEAPEGDSAFAENSEALLQGGTLDDRSRSGGYEEVGAWGVYTVPAGSSLDSHDPRVERRFDDKKIDTNAPRSFQARYNIVSADNTTIAQVLNTDSHSSDTNKPVIFIIARSSGNNWDIYNQGTKLFSLPKNSGSNRPVLTLRVDSYSKQVNGAVAMFSDIFINGSKKGTFQHARVGDQSTMRYGAYHHGNGTAQIRVKDVSFR